MRLFKCWFNLNIIGYQRRFVVVSFCLFCTHLLSILVLILKKGSCLGCTSINCQMIVSANFFISQLLQQLLTFPICTLYLLVLLIEIGSIIPVYCWLNVDNFGNALIGESLHWLIMDAFVWEARVYLRKHVARLVVLLHQSGAQVRLIRLVFLEAISSICLVIGRIVVRLIRLELILVFESPMSHRSLNQIYAVICNLLLMRSFVGLTCDLPLYVDDLSRVCTALDERVGRALPLMPRFCLHRPKLVINLKHALVLSFLQCFLLLLSKRLHE